MASSSYADLLSAGTMTYLANNGPIDGRPEAVIGHVVMSNVKPRRVLESLGFHVRDRNQRYRPSDIPGLEHMPTDSSGFLYADTYQLRPDAWAGLITEIADYKGMVNGRDGTQRHVEVRVSSLEPTSLRELLKELESDT